MAQGSGRYASSGRISYALGLRGPSLTIDTACSSSLVALHLAVRSIRSGESNMALAGGANIILQPHINIAYSQSRMMSADGRCKFGDASGDGYVRSEGVALVVLKALDRASSRRRQNLRRDPRQCDQQRWLQQRLYGNTEPDWPGGSAARCLS